MNCLSSVFNNFPNEDAVFKIASTYIQELYVGVYLGDTSCSWTTGCLSLCFVFSYSWKIQEGCINKVAEKLTINTIRYWLPNLYPTDFKG